MWTSSATIIAKVDELIRLQRETNQLLREQIQAQTRHPALTPKVGEAPKRALPYTYKDVSRVGDSHDARLARNPSASPIDAT